MAKTERRYTADEGAYMTRLTINSFRVKVSVLGIRGMRDGSRVYYSHKQLEDIYNGVSAKKNGKPKTTKTKRK